MTTQPKPLQKGDKVYILSTARAISLAKIDLAIQRLESWGLQVVIGTTIGTQHFQFAASDEERLADFQRAINDESIKAIFCARGGYGTVRIIDDIDFDAFFRSPKWIVGFSDITVLHSHLHNNFEIASIHAAMPSTYSYSSERDLDSLRNSLFGIANPYEVEASPFNKEGSGTGVLVGGNLSILYNLIGTASDIDTTNKLLLLEEVGENLMAIDRMFYALLRSGKLTDLAGLIIGDFTIATTASDATSNSIIEAKNVQEALKKMVLGFCKDFDYPICFEFPSGHEKQRNVSLVLGVEVCLEVGETVTLGKGKLIN